MMGLVVGEAGPETSLQSWNACKSLRAGEHQMVQKLQQGTGTVLLLGSKPKGRQDGESVPGQ